MQVTNLYPLPAVNLNVSMTANPGSLSPRSVTHVSQTKILDLDDELEQISKIMNRAERESQFVAFAESHGNVHDRIKIVHTFHRLHGTSSALNPFIVLVANSYFLAGDWGNAQEVIIKLVCGHKDDKIIRNNFIVKLAQSWYEAGNYECAFKCIRSLTPWNKQRHAFLMKLFETRLNAIELDLALKVVLAMDDTTQHLSLDRENCLIKLAETCLKERNWNFAAGAINLITHNEKIKVYLTYKLVDSCLEVNDVESAFRAMERFKQPELPELRDKMALVFCKILQSYFGAGDREKSYKCIKRIIYPLLLNELTLNGVGNKYKKGLIQSDRIKTFCDHLAGICYDEIHIFFDQDNILDEIQHFITHRSSLEAFEDYFNLKDEASDKPSRPEQYPGENDVFYSRLGLNSSATKIEIKSKYKTLALQYHPDRLKRYANETDELFEQRKKESGVKFAAISSAYNKIIDLC
jgi:uncharacterized protein YutD